MIHIVRPLPGYLLLCDGEKALTYALPDSEFWLWLRNSGTEALLESENPARMERVRKNGVGVLRNHKDMLIKAGFATLEECKTKRPPEKPVLISIAAIEGERIP